MDGFDHLYQIVLTLCVVDVKVREVRDIQRIRQRGIIQIVIHATQGDKGGAGAGTANEVCHGGFGGIFLGALREVGQRVGGLHPVLQNKLADPDGLQQMRIGVLHNGSSLVLAAGVWKYKAAGKFVYLQLYCIEIF